MKRTIKRETTKRHIWSQQDYDLLEKSIKLHGFTEGCKITAKMIGSTYSSCSTKWQKIKFTSTSTEPLPSKVFTEKKTRRHVTADEEVKIAEYLRNEISKNPNNINEAFRKCAEHFGFGSPRAIQHRWYGCKIGKTDYSTRPSCRKNIGIVYSLVGDTVTVNGKNSKKPDKKGTRWILSIIRKLFSKKEDK